MTRPSSLATTIMKEKYVKQNKLLEISIKENSSQTCKSIMLARNLTKDGIKWWVENGETIRIWKDQWLPTMTNFKVQSPLRNLSPTACVKELLNTEGT